MCSRARVAGYQSALRGGGNPDRSRAVRRRRVHARGRRAGGAAAAGPVESADRDRRGKRHAGARGVRRGAPRSASSVPRRPVGGRLRRRSARALGGPPLTTMRQPLQEMAEEATRLALRMRAETWRTSGSTWRRLSWCVGSTARRGRHPPDENFPIHRCETCASAFAEQRYRLTARSARRSEHR